MKKTQRIRRRFNGSANAMITGISTIADNALNHASKLLEADSTFTAAYLADFRSRIDSASRLALGADHAEVLRQATIVLRATTKAAVVELGLTKAWIEGKFADDVIRRDELLNNLGFSAFYATAVNGRKSNYMMQLLLRFDEHLDAELAEELAALGLPVARIAALHKLAAAYSDQNIDQQGQKGQRVVITSADTALLNGLYKEAITIARLARRLFKDDPAIRATFTYEKASPVRSNGKDDKDEHKDAAAA